MTFAALRRLLLSPAILLLAGAVAVAPRIAAAQDFAPVGSFTPLPSLAWPQPNAEPDKRWAGSYGRMSAGFEVASSKHFGSYWGPTLGFEGGRMWQDGSLVYGIVGGFDYLDVIGGGYSPRPGGLTFRRDFAGALQVKVGTLLTPDLLLYAKAGAVAAHDNFRFGATSFSPSFTREDIVVQPDARVGMEWAVTDRLSVAVEAGMAGGGSRW